VLEHADAVEETLGMVQFHLSAASRRIRVTNL
jgi:hypothetical protein